MDLEKDNMRKKYIEVRKQIEGKAEKSNAICKRLLETEEYKNASTIAAYMPLESEASTLGIIRKALEDGKKVVLPRVEANEIVFYDYKLDDELIKSSFGINEPKGEEAKKADKDSIDMIILPGLVFDIDRNRLGFGRGFYDRFLCDFNKTKIGICFDEQITDLVPTDIFDVKMDEVITDKRLIGGK